MVNTMDMMSQIVQNTGSNAKNVASSTDNKNQSSDFESLLKEQASTSEGQSNVSKENTEDSHQGTDNKLDGDDGSTVVTDAQREMMVALTLQNVQYRTVDVVVEETVDGEVEIINPVDEVEMLDNGVLNLNLQVETEVLVDAEQQVEEIVELVVDGEIVLNDLEDIEMTGPIEVEVELQPELEEVAVEVQEQVVEVEEEVEVLEAEIEVKQEEGSEKVEVRDERSVEADTEEVVVEQGEQTNRLFQDVKAAPVKVAETVDTREPDMDTQIAKIIQKAHNEGDSTVTIRLNPDGLGTVTAQITQTADGVMQVVLQTTDDIATNLLKSHVAQLVQALQGTAQTVTVEVQNTSETEAGSQEMQQENPEEHEQQQKEQENQEEIDVVFSDDFMQQLRLGLGNFSLEL